MSNNELAISVTAKRTQEEIMLDWTVRSPPLLSVCCVTYNQIQYIRNAVDSFLMQETNFPFEIILYDDASSDGTIDVLKEYAKKYPDIIRTIIQTENQWSKGGLIIPRYLFPKARGKYIAVCDGDDYWTDKTKLQQQVTFLENNPEYVITYTGCQPFDENGELTKFFGGRTQDLESIELKKAPPMYTLTTCFRNVIKEIPQDLMSARYGDLVIWSLLGAYGRGKYISDIKPAAYRVHDAGLHSKQTRRQQDEMALITCVALFSYYTRLGDSELARYFHEKSFKLSLRVIGWKGLFPISIQELIRRILVINLRIRHLLRSNKK